MTPNVVALVLFLIVLAFATRSALGLGVWRGTGPICADGKCLPGEIIVTKSKIGGGGVPCFGWAGYKVLCHNLKKPSPLNPCLDPQRIKKLKMGCSGRDMMCEYGVFHYTPRGYIWQRCSGPRQCGPCYRIELEPIFERYYEWPPGDPQPIPPVEIDLPFDGEVFNVQSDTMRDSETCSSLNLPNGPDTCKDGYVWREAIPGDHVCVSPESRTQAKKDNELAARRVNKTDQTFGPNTCIQGYVWRELVPWDTVCVIPEIREQIAKENLEAKVNRVACNDWNLPYGLDTCKNGYVWREAVPNDHVCVTPESRTQAKKDNESAASRVSTSDQTFGPNTCIQGYVWREAVSWDTVCVTPEIRDQTAKENLEAANNRVLSAWA